MNKTSITRELLTAIDQLPTLPHTLVKLLDICNNPEVDIQLIGKTISRDASLSAKILQLANSAFLGSRSSFTGIEQAVIFLGIDSVRSLAISVSVQETFQQNQVGPLNLREFWYHSLLTALIAKRLAEICSYPHPAEPYLAGLLHDIGKCIFNQLSPEKYSEITENRTPSGELTELEHRVFGISHQEIGALLTERWKLDEKITRAIREHHSSTLHLEKTDRLSRLIHIANLLAQETGTGYNNTLRQVENLEVPGERIPEIIQEQKAIVFSIAESMNMSISAPVIPQQRLQGRKTVSAEKTGKEQLQKTVETIALNHGLLDSLSRAETPDRIFALFEENLQTVFCIHKCIILLPDNRAPGKLSVHGSIGNPIARQMQHGSLSLDTESAFFKKLTENHGIIRLQDGGNDQSRIFVSRLRLIMKENCFAVIPFTLMGNGKGIVLVAVDSHEFATVMSKEKPLVLACTYLGNRLNLELLKEKHAEELARERAAAKESIARSIAHEISNPLAIIQNYISLLADNLQDPELQKDLQVISNELDRINGISKRLNNLSGTESPAGLEKVNINRIVAETVDLFKKSFKTTSTISITLSLAPEEITALSRPGAIRQILNNLINNSIEALGDTGTIRVETLLEHDNTLRKSPCVKIIVSDNGPGISSSVSETLYKPGHTTKDREHAGLGLAIIRKIINDLGGSIQHVSDPETGTTFTVTIPLTS